MIRGHKFLLTLGLGALRLLTSLGKHGVAELGSGLPALGQALGRRCLCPPRRATWSGGMGWRHKRPAREGCAGRNPPCVFVCSLSVEQGFLSGAHGWL